MTREHGGTLAGLEGHCLRPGQPLYDEAARRELDRRVEHLGRVRGRGSEAWWLEGNELLIIRDRRLYVQDGYANMGAWVTGHLHRSRDPVTRRMRLAENYSLQQVRRHGADKLLLALQYVGATLADDEAWDLPTLVVKVPRDGGIEELAFDKVTEDELDLALAHQRELAQRRAQKELPASEAPLFEHLQKALSVDSDRALARMSARPAATGLSEDTTLKLELRLGDLRSVLVRLQAALESAPKPPAGSHRRSREH